MENSYAFGGRYLTLGILIYVLSTYLGLNFNNLDNINISLFLIFSVVFTLALLVIAAVLCIFLRKNRPLAALIVAVLLSVLIFVAGFVRTCYFLHSCKQNRNVIENHRTVSGIIKSDPVLNSTGKSYVFDFNVHSASSPEETITLEKPCKIRMYVAKDALSGIPEVNSSMSFAINLSLIKDAAFKHGFNYERNLLQENIVFAGYSNNAKTIDPIPAGNSFFSALSGFGTKIRNHLLKSADYYNYGEDEKQLLQGIMVGKTDDFSEQLYAMYSSSGFIHIASVSGMHTSYLFLTISLLLGLLRFPRRGIYLLAIPILIVFGAVSQFTPSVSRAVITMCVFLLAGILKRNNDSITSLSISALVLLIINPTYLENCSFLLSFGATLGILIFFPLINKFFSFAVIKKPLSPDNSTAAYRFINEIPYRLNLGAVASIALSLSAVIGIGYFMARFFGKLQWGNIFGNILISPMVAVVFIFSYINSAIGLFSLKTAFIIGRSIINPSLSLINAVTSLFAKSFFSFSVPHPSDGFFVIYIIICWGLYLLLLPSKKRQ